MPKGNLKKIVVTSNLLEKTLDADDATYIDVIDKRLEKNSEIAIDINVDLIENLGSEKIIYTQLNDTEIRIKSSINIKDKNIRIRNLNLENQTIKFSVEENLKQQIIDIFNDENSLLIGIETV